MSVQPDASGAGRTSAPEFAAPPPKKLPAQNPLLANATTVNARGAEPSTSSTAAISRASVPSEYVKEAAARPGKVPLAPGYSQMRWMQLSRAEDLSGRGGTPLRRDITMDEVRQHSSTEDAWTVLRGRVYNISAYLRYHPGGVDWIMKGAGRDCTPLFTKYHAWVNAEMLLESCLVGMLAGAGQPTPA